MLRSSVGAPLAALHTWMCRYSDCPLGWRPSAFGHFRVSPQMFEFWQVRSGTAQLRSWTVDQILVLSGVSWSWNEDGDGWLPPLRSSASSLWFRVTLDSFIQAASSEKNPGGSKRLPFNIQSAEGNQEMGGSWSWNLNTNVSVFDKSADQIWVIDYRLRWRWPLIVLWV